MTLQSSIGVTKTFSIAAHVLHPAFIKNLRNANAKYEAHPKKLGLQQHCLTIQFRAGVEVSDNTAWIGKLVSNQNLFRSCK